MGLLNKRKYKKKLPWRDAIIFIVICEGSHKEPEYFNFFHLLTEKIKVIAIPSKDGKSSPKHLVNNAYEAVSKYNSDEGSYELWVVIDVDRWRSQIHLLQQEASQNNWNVAISNPCFEVWLNEHFENVTIPSNKIETCKTWKKHVHEKYGGFDHNKHQTYLGRAIKNAKNQYSGKGYMPDVGKTQVFHLGERLLSLTRKELEKYFE